MSKRNVGVIISGILLVILMVGGIGFLIWHMTSTHASTVVNEPSHDLAATPQNLEYLGLDFIPIPVSDPRAKGAIPSAQAVRAALEEEPGLKAATRVSSMLGLLHDLNLQQAAKQGMPIDPSLADMGLVWIVTFEGIDTASSGPNQAPKYLAHEYNVVINAKTGGSVMAFPLADITPTNP
jgi:hypothetical protein